MPFYKIEKSGCTVRKNRVQIRFDFFLEEKDTLCADRLEQIVGQNDN